MAEAQKPGAKKAPAKPKTKTTATKPKTSTKTPTKTATAARNTSATKPRTATTPKPAAKKHNSGTVWKIVIGVLAVVALVCWVAFFILRGVGTGKLEKGNGDKIAAEYVALKDFDYRVLIPKDFRMMSTDEIKDAFGTEDDAAIVAYTNDDDVVVALMKPENGLSNDDVEAYLTAMESILKLSADVISTNFYEKDGHNIATIKYVTEAGGEKIYNYVTSFSDNDKLAIVNFACKDDQRAEWEKLGDEITNSIEF